MDRGGPRLVCFLLLGVAIAFGGSAWSSPLPFNDGFENAAVGTYPSSSGWVTLSVGKRAPYGAYVSNFVAHTGSKSFRLDSYPWARQMDYVRLDDVPDRLSYEVSVWVDPDYGWVGVVGFMTRNGYYPAMWNHFRIDGGYGGVSFCGEEVVYLGTYAPGTWCTVRAELDFQPLKADLWVNGECVAEGVDITPKAFYDCYGASVELNQWGVAAPDYLEYPYVSFANAVYFDDVSLWEFSTTLAAQVDVKPGGNPNTINLKSKGVVPVAVLSGEGFDATEIDPETVTLAGAGVAVKGKHGKLMAHIEDVDGNGLDDLVLQFPVPSLDPAELQDGVAVVRGSTYGGEAFEGSDEVVLVPAP